MCFNNNNKKIVFLINKLEMADKNKIKVAVRVRPFNRRGNFFFPCSFFFFIICFNILLYLKKIIWNVSLETKTRTHKI